MEETKSTNLLDNWIGDAMAERGLDRGNREEKAGELADVMVMAHRTFMLDLEAKLRDLGITYQKFHLLGYLDGSNPVSMKEISEKFGITMAAATGLVDRLEKINLTCRLPDPKDRRRIFVQLTREGRKKIEQVRGLICNLIVEAMEENTEDEDQEADSESSPELIPPETEEFISQN